MTVDICFQCSEILNGTSTDGQQATRVDVAHPHCACEKHSVGDGSPGPVGPDEVVYRFVVSPGDIDPHTGILLLDSLRDVKSDGLSMIRSLASDIDIEELVRERLTIKAGAQIRTVDAILQISVSELQQLTRDDWGRLFCVYDETVPRKNSNLPPIPTHATLLQRVPPPKTDGRKGTMKADQTVLYKKLITNKVDIASFRSGLIAQLNSKSLAGEFTLPNDKNF